MAYKERMSNYFDIIDSDNNGVITGDEATNTAKVSLSF